MARHRASSAPRSPDVTFTDSTGWPRKGGSVSVVASLAGQMKTIEGTVLELEPRTAVSSGRLIVQDNSTGEMIELPAPIILKG